MARQRWVPSQAAKYLQQVAAFQQQLLLCIHFTGGMPGRGTEIGTMKWCNTRTTMRNVFVLHALLLIVLEYQKAQYSTHRAFYVVRALPPAVSQLLFRYLAFVRPFAEAEALSHQVDQLGSGQSERAPYIFATVGITATIRRLMILLRGLPSNWLFAKYRKYQAFSEAIRKWQNPLVLPLQSFPATLLARYSIRVGGFPF
jgi:hypothetical protein